MIRSAIRQHRRPVEQALVGAARGQPCTGLDAPGDERVDAITLAGIDDRAERGIRRRAVTDREAVGCGRQSFDVLVIDVLVHENIYDEYVERLSATANGLPVGHGATTDAPLGPVI